MCRLETLFKFGIALLGCVACGCTGLTGTPHANAFVATPGQYPPPPAGATRPHVGVPAMAASVREGLENSVPVGEISADQLVTLLLASDRLSPIDRERVMALAREQGRGDSLRNGTLVRPASLAGIDYLLLGEVRDLSVRREPPPEQLSVAGVEQMLNVAPQWHPRLFVDCTIALRLVRPSDGAIILTSQTPFHRAAFPKEIGLTVSADGEGEIKLSQSDSAKVLRLALDAALRDMLPRLDQWTVALAHQPAGTQPVVASAHPTTAPAGVTSGSQKALTLICPECGFRVSKDDQFCPNCGAKLR